MTPSQEHVAGDRLERSGQVGERAAADRPVVRPRLYVAAVVLAMAAAFTAHVGRNGVFACPAAYQGGDYYLAYCQAADYGDFEHGAYWFGLEPAARRAAATADVIFLGDSRLQLGFSTQAVASWFADADRSYHLLGFGYDENIAFGGPLVASLEPAARAYVISLDDYFVDAPTAPAREIVRGAVYTRYLTKKAWQLPHRALCTPAPVLCGGNGAFFRSRETGEWRVAGQAPSLGYAREDLPVDWDYVERARPLGEQFIASLPVDRSCVFLTYVWTPYNARATAEVLAVELGGTLVSPQLAGLETFDSSHLEPESAERFAQAFLDKAGPELARCLEVEQPPGPIASAGG